MCRAAIVLFFVETTDYNYVVNGRVESQIIPRAGGRWSDIERSGKKIGEIVSDPRTWGSK